MGSYLSDRTVVETLVPLLTDAALKSCALILVAWFFTWRLRKQTAAWRHLIWTMTAVALLLLPVGSAVLPAWQVPVPRSWFDFWHEMDSLVAVSPQAPEPLTAPDTVSDRPAASPDAARGAAPGRDLPANSNLPIGQPLAPAAAENASPTVTTEALSVTSQATTAAEPRVSQLAIVVSWLPAAWFAGVLAAAAIPAVGLCQLVWLRQRGQWNHDRAWQRLMLETRTALGIRRSIRVLIHNGIRMPLTWGLWRPVLLLPAEADSWPTSRRRVVLLHELAHIKRCDWLTQLIGQLACCLHWFNPLVWYVARRMQVEREEACDDVVLSAGTTASDYAQELLHFARRLRGGSFQAMVAIPMARPSSLERRVRSILDSTRRRGSITRWALVAGLAICLGVSVPLAMVRALATDPGPATSMVAQPAGLPQGNPATGQRSSESQDQPEQNTIVVDRPGKWSLESGVLMEIQQQLVHAADVMTTVVLRWGATDDRPALRHEIFVAGDAFANRDKWVVAWQADQPRLYLANTGPGGEGPANLRAVDFRDPKSIVTWTEYANEQFDIGEPDKLAGAGNRRAASIAEPLPRVPADILSGMAEKLPALEKLGKGLHRFGGQHSESAKTAVEWTIHGTVRDAQGKPIKGVLMQAFTEYHPTTVVVAERTADDGSYTLRFPMDLTTLSKFRGVRVTPNLSGMVDEQFGRGGEFTMLLAADEEVDRSFSDRMALIGGTVTADFKMLPAVTVEGQVVDQNGQPRAKAYVGLRYAGQRQGYTLASTGADEEGRFRLPNVPPGQPFILMAAAFQAPHSTREVEGFIADPQGRDRLQLKLAEDAGNWQLTYQRQAVDQSSGPASVRVRVVELQKELSPPASPAGFADQVAAWAESCRWNNSAAILEHNPQVWNQVITWHSLVHVVFDPPRRLRLIQADQTRKTPLPISEIAFSMNETGPGALFLKSGDQVLVLEHWTLDAMLAVIREPALRATEKPWYQRYLTATSDSSDLDPDETAIVNVAGDGSLSFNGNPVAANELVKMLKDAGFDPKTSVVVLRVDDTKTRVSELHWPMFHLTRDRWARFRIQIAANPTPDDRDEEDGNQTARASGPGPSVSLLSGEGHSACALQTDEEVLWVLYAPGSLQSEIEPSRLADGGWQFSGPLHLLPDGQPPLSFQVVYSSQDPDTLLLDGQAYPLSRVIGESNQGPIKSSDRLIALSESDPPLQTRRTLPLRNAQDLETIHQMAGRDLHLAQHYRFSRQLDLMTGWVVAWNEQHMIQHSDGARRAMLRIFPDGRVVVADLRQGLLSYRLDEQELNQLLVELTEHRAAARVAPVVEVPAESGLRMTDPRVFSGPRWDQAVSEILVKHGDATYQLRYESPSPDGQPQNGMLDEDWKELAPKMWALYQRGQPSSD